MPRIPRPKKSILEGSGITVRGVLESWNAKCPIVVLEVQPLVGLVVVEAEVPDPLIDQYQLSFVSAAVLFATENQ